MTIPFVREIDRSLCVAGCPTLEYVKAHVDGAIAGARAHAGGIAVFLQEAAGDFERRINANGAPAFTAKEKNRCVRMIDSWRRRAAATRDASERRASEGGAALYLAETECLRELNEGLEFAASVAADMMAPCALSLPAIEFATSFGASVGANCRPVDGQGRLASEVTLVLPESGFDRESFYAIPYLLSHEIICHAAQGVAGASPRQPSGPNCAWSDGWTDRLAFEASADALLGAPTRPEWIEEGASAISVMTEQAHSARDRGPANSRKAQAALFVRRQAKEAYLQLKRESALQFGDLAEAELFTRLFSIKYNALAIDPSERAEFVAWMTITLNGSTAEKTAAIEAVSAFIKDEDKDRLHAQFTP